ncbi:hypothetical protein Hanom_Chr17g01534391 [Helianthus anomalus]
MSQIIKFDECHTLLIIANFPTLKTNKNLKKKRKKKRKKDDVSISTYFGYQSIVIR